MFTVLLNLIVMCGHDNVLVAILFSGEVLFLPVVPLCVVLSDRGGTKKLFSVMDKAN